MCVCVCVCVCVCLCDLLKYSFSVAVHYADWLATVEPRTMTSRMHCISYLTLFGSFLFSSSILKSSGGAWIDDPQRFQWRPFPQ